MTRAIMAIGQAETTGTTMETKQRPARSRDALQLQNLTRRHDRLTLEVTPGLNYFDAVALFSMLTTCTRRFASASGWLGSLSLVLPYPTVTRSVPAMPNLSTR